MHAWIENRRRGLDGAAGARLRRASDLLAELRPIMARAGVTRLANVTGLDRVGLPVVMAVRPEARAVAVSLGKGATFEDAALGGLMETLETWHAERIALPLRLASLDGLRAEGMNVVDPDALAKTVDAPFPAERPLLWVEGRTMDDGVRLVPFEAVHTDYARPGPPASGVLAMSSNGLAAGAHPIEALVQGLLEAIERDAHARFEDAPAGPPLDLAAIDDDALRDLLARAAAADVAVRAWPMPNPAGVPAVLCLVVDGTGALPPARGQAADLDPVSALRRALMEALQTRLTFIAGARDDLDPGDYARGAIKAANARAQRWGGAPPTAPLPEPLPAAGIVARAATLLERLEAAGFAGTVAVELPPIVPAIAVLRVVVPGLRLDGG